MIVYTPAPLRPARAGDWRADDWRCGRTEVRPETSSPVAVYVDDDSVVGTDDCPF